MTHPETPLKHQEKANCKAAWVMVGVGVFMFGLAFAAVPLYSLFCQVTGYGGAPKKIENYQQSNSTKAPGRTLTVRFNADVAGGMPWGFKPSQKEIKVKVGESSLAFYDAHNPTQKAITGTAIYNVTPNKAGEYFVKQHCFCFDEQTLEAGKEAHMPVSFFIDPAISDDSNLDDVNTITLSYTFFKSNTQPSNAR